MIYGSLFSGIEAASVAWDTLGWEPAFFAEIDKFPSAVLNHHWPDVQNLGDVTKIDCTQWRDKLDVLIGGPPCQSFSSAAHGGGGGLDDTRGKMSLVYANIINEINPKVFIFENVLGLLYNKDNAFGEIIGNITGLEGVKPENGKWEKCGFAVGPKRNVAWRVLDAKYFGVPQQRRRLYIVGCPVNGSDPREILFEYSSMQDGVHEGGAEQVENAKRTKGGFIAGHKWRYSKTLTTCGARDRDVTRHAYVTACGRPRFLIPVECERLQGFKDNHTMIPWRGKKDVDCPNGLRYKAIGNSMAVPVIKWIGERIQNTLGGTK